MIPKRPRRRLPWVVYEARPFVAIGVGALAAILALVHALARGEESAAACAGLAAGCLLLLYGGMIGQMRTDHRRRVRLIAQIKAEWRQHAERSGRLGARSHAPARTPSRLDFLKDPGMPAALACIVVGVVVAGVALVTALDAGDLSAWRGVWLAFGSIIAVYGGLLHRSRPGH